MTALPSACLCIICMPGTCVCQKRVGSLGTGIMGGCEPPCKCWKLSLVPLQVQQVLLTSEPSLQPSCYFLKILFVLL